MNNEINDAFVNFLYKINVSERSKWFNFQKM